MSRNIVLPANISLGEVKMSGDINIGDYFSIADNSQVLAKFGKISIGERVSIGPNVLIQSYSHNKNIKETSNNWLKSQMPIEKFNELVHQTSGDINIGNDVWIGANVVILPGTTIGNGTIIGANTVVTGEIEDNKILFAKRDYIQLDRKYN